MFDELLGPALRLANSIVSTESLRPTVNGNAPTFSGQLIFHEEVAYVAVSVSGNFRWYPFPHGIRCTGSVVTDRLVDLEEKGRPSQFSLLIHGEELYVSVLVDSGWRWYRVTDNRKTEALEAKVDQLQGLVHMLAKAFLSKNPDEVIEVENKLASLGAKVP